MKTQYTLERYSNKSVNFERLQPFSGKYSNKLKPQLVLIEAPAQLDFENDLRTHSSRSIIIPLGLRVATRGRLVVIMTL